jgi:hypothetical protein
MPGNPNPGARDRAEHELRADPARSNHVIAAAAKCSHQRVSVWRAELVAAGVIEHIEPSARLARQRPAAWPSRMRDAIDAGCQTPEQVMEFGLAYSTACIALARARAARPVAQRQADAAAATDSLAVDRVRPITYHVSAERPPAGWYAPADLIETRCPCCTLIWRDGAFTHEPSCPARRVRTAG